MNEEVVNTEVETQVETASPENTQEVNSSTREPLLNTPEPEAQAVPEEQASEFKVPDEYKERGWVKNLKSEQDVWKALDNAQSLIGKKTVVPDFEKATPEQIEEYYNSLRPKDKSAYQFDESMSEEERSAYGELLYKHGISAKQGNDLVKEYLGMQQQAIEKAFDKDSFIDGLKKDFGSEYEDSFKSLTSTLRKNLSEEDRNLVDNHLSNDHLRLIYRLVNNMQKSYGIKESDAVLSAEKVGGDIATRRKELRDRISQVANDPVRFREKDKLVEELRRTYE